MIRPSALPDSGGAGDPDWNGDVVLPVDDHRVIFFTSVKHSDHLSEHLMINLFADGVTAHTRRDLA